MQIFDTEKYALRVNFLILIEQTSEFSSGVSIISYFDVSFCYEKKKSIDYFFKFPSNTVFENPNGKQVKTGQRIRSCTRPPRSWQTQVLPVLLPVLLPVIHFFFCSETSMSKKFKLLAAVASPSVLLSI
jgi:hypothetical protein